MITHRHAFFRELLLHERRIQPRCSASGLSILERVQVDGFQDGLKNRHYIPEAWYRTPEEWRAWYSGWKQGQAMYWAKQRQIEEAQMAEARMRLRASA